MQVLSTVDDVLQFVARYAGGTVPQTSDSQYGEWLSWISEGQEDMAERGFWSRLLTKTELDISTDDEFTVLPEDFHKRNGIYVLDTGEEDWNDPYNRSNQKLFVNKNEEGEWVVYYNGFAPTEDITATLWYFRHPGVIEDAEDILILDGKACGYYALTEYFRQAGELGSLDDARAEYNNRFEELLGMEMLPAPNELLSWRSYGNYTGIKSEKSFYSRNRLRRT